MRVSTIDNDYLTQQSVIAGHEINGLQRKST